jgi:hypothetical protein
LALASTEALLISIVATRARSVEARPVRGIAGELYGDLFKRFSCSDLR